MSRSILCALAVVSFWMSGAFYSASWAEPAARFLKIPIFIVTDRNLVSNDTAGGAIFGPHRKYIGMCNHDPFMGVAYCVVENVNNKPITKALSDLGWEDCDKGKLGTVETKLITGANFDVIQKEFYAKLYDSSMHTPDHEIFGFVHGFKNSFLSGIQPAARLAYFAERPLLFYSWPSAGKLRAYTTDENNVEWSQEHFNDVAVKLTELGTRQPPMSVRMFAHSMGTRLVVRATPIFRENGTFKEFGLVCPDIDEGLVMHYAHRYLSTKGTATVRLYMSRKDEALVLSQLIHGGYNRMGECADSLGALASESMNNLVHLLPGAPAIAAEKPSEKDAEEIAFEAGLESSKHRFQTIDFTVLDGGMIGHRIPAELICNMAHIGNPGSGLELVKEDSGKRNRNSLFLAAATHLKNKDKELGTVFLVSRIGGNKRGKSKSGQNEVRTEDPSSVTPPAEPIQIVKPAQAAEAQTERSVEATTSSATTNAATTATTTANTAATTAATTTTTAATTTTTAATTDVPVATTSEQPAATVPAAPGH